MNTERYIRQTLVKEFGLQGQQKLQEASVAVIGCGGLGNAVAVYLAASGIGQLHLIDYDTVNLSNLHRQVFFKTNDVNTSKSETLKQHITEINPSVKVSTQSLAINKNNVLSTLQPFQIIVDCTDNLHTKFLINDACVILNKPLVYGSLHKFDGYVATFNHEVNNKKTAHLRDAFPNIPNKRLPNCSEVGTLNPIVGMVAMLQTNEVIKLVAGIGAPLVNQILIYNSWHNSQHKMRLQPKMEVEQVKAIFKQSNYLALDCDLQREDWLVTAKQLKDIINDNREQWVIVSVIENISQQLPIQVDQQIPLSKLDPQQFNIDDSKQYLMVCNRGISSYSATKKLKTNHPNLNVFSLKNGISSLV